MRSDTEASDSENEPLQESKSSESHEHGEYGNGLTYRKTPGE